LERRREKRIMKPNDDLNKHKEKMLAFMLKKKGKKIKLPPPPSDDTEEKVKALPPPPSKAEKLTVEEMTKYELDKELTRKRIRQTEVRTMAFEMDLARIREELIEKELVLKQLSFLVVAMRQQILTIPSTYARKLLHKSELKEVHAILKQMSHHLLNELRNVPQKAVDPNWLETLDEEDEQGEADVSK
jgi:phage terminase Nu1 subunit (DNA packaging protein)